MKPHVDDGFRNRRRGLDATRRDFLKVGALGLGGLTFPWLLGNPARGAGARDYVRDKSVVFLFLSGGASQFETFDPKMTAPAEFRSLNGEIRTSLPGITFGGTLPRLASMAHRLAVIRSFVGPQDSAHDGAIRRVLKAGSADPAGASIGAIAARLAGSVHPTTATPTFIQLADPEPGGEYEEARGRYYVGNSPGSLGPAYAPFDPSREGDLRSNMTLRVPVERLTDRRALLSAFDNLQRELDVNGRMATHDAGQRQAFEVLRGECRTAFDLSRENPGVLDRYDTSRIIVGYSGSSRSANYRDHPSPLGRHLLLARRLCEAGCGVVTINSPAWDSHGDGVHPNIVYTMEHEARALDHAVTAFIEDVAQRGLTDRILLVIATEFGRTPRIDRAGGRDHWPGLCPLVLAGGGWRMGQVIGRSDARAERPNGEPISTRNLLGTILQTLFDTNRLRLAESAPPNLVRMIEESEPIVHLT
ncbi:MAG: DUF1501 domain-containing protein [Planctomycetes bacterium]|nr:DUF1501 domain-containing protein [Planctomycetota bacterium]